MARNTIEVPCKFCAGRTVGHGKRRQDGAPLRLCKGCGRSFAMGPELPPAHFGTRKTDNPNADGSASRAMWASRTPEQRAAIAAKISASRKGQTRPGTPEEWRASAAKVPPERRAEIAKIGAAALHQGPEEVRRARVEKARATILGRGWVCRGEALERVRAASRRLLVNLSPEERSRRMTLGWARIPPEERSARALERERRKRARAAEVRRLGEGKGERWRLVAATLEEDPWTEYAVIAERLGISKQRVQQIAREMGHGARIGVSGSCEECGRPGKSHRTARGRVLCDAHFDQFREKGETSVLPRDRYTSPVCAVDGCSEPRKTKGMCERHYINWRYNNVPGVRDRHRTMMNRYLTRRARGEVAAPLPRCFDCDKALRARFRKELEIGGDVETFCPSCHARRVGEVLIVTPQNVAAPSEEAFLAIERAVAGLHEEVRDDVRQQLFVELLEGTLNVALVRERIRSLRRQAMVAASDRQFSFVSLDDPAGDTDRTMGDVIDGGRRWRE